MPHPETQRLSRAIARGMRYWYARTILAYSSIAASAYARYCPAERYDQCDRIYHQAYKKRRYYELKANGFTYYETKAALDGVTPRVAKQRANLANQRIRLRWGGSLGPGSLSWIHREQVQLANLIQEVTQ